MDGQKDIGKIELIESAEKIFYRKAYIIYKICRSDLPADDFFPFFNHPLILFYPFEAFGIVLNPFCVNLPEQMPALFG